MLLFQGDKLEDEWEDIDTERRLVSLGMRRGRGGSFVQALGEALSHADTNNTSKIKKAFPEYWKEYLEEGKILEEKGYG